MSRLQLFWHNNATKLWGIAVVVTGAAGEALVYIQQLDPKHAALWGAAITIGCAVIRRGFTNTRNQAVSP